MVTLDQVVFSDPNDVVGFIANNGSFHGHHILVVKGFLGVANQLLNSSPEILRGLLPDLYRMQMEAYEMVRVLDLAEQSSMHYTHYSLVSLMKSFVGGASFAARRAFYETGNPGWAVEWYNGEKKVSDLWKGENDRHITYVSFAAKAAKELCEWLLDAGMEEDAARWALKWHEAKLYAGENYRGNDLSQSPWYFISAGDAMVQLFALEGDTGHYDKARECYERAVGMIPFDDKETCAIAMARLARLDRKSTRQPLHSP